MFQKGGRENRMGWHGLDNVRRHKWYRYEGGICPVILNRAQLDWKQSSLIPRRGNELKGEGKGELRGVFFCLVLSKQWNPPDARCGAEPRPLPFVLTEAAAATAAGCCRGKNLAPGFLEKPWEEPSVSLSIFGAAEYMISRTEGLEIWAVFTVNVAVLREGNSPELVFGKRTIFS
jgi:hypothetical protein